MFPQIFGKYVLEREMASGGMARVYLGTLRGAVGFEKRLVVKQIRPELAFDDAFVERFVAEAKVAVELSHPNIVPVYELGVEQGIFYIAMELCEGSTLSEVLNETGPLSPEEGAYVGIEICRALDYAHRRAGIVHRDVTPRNVMIDEEGAVRLIDFGIAAPATLEDGGGRKKAEVFGSPGHMPPEQIAGKELSPATDVFAVGALLMEAWTGKPPFRRSTPAECLEALKSPPPRLDAMRTELAPLSDLIESTLALAPDQRPESAEQLARPLRDFVESADLGNVARRIGERVRRARSRVHDSAPFAVGEGLTGVGATPSTMQVEPRKRLPSISDTQTFAARDNLVEWTRKIPTVPPPSDDDDDEGDDPEVEVAEEDDRPLSQDEPEPTTGDRRSEVGRGRSRWTLVAVVAGAAALIWGGARIVAPPTIPPEPLSTTSATPEPSEPEPSVTRPPATVSGSAPISSETAPKSPTSAPPIPIRSPGSANPVAVASDAGPVAKATLIVNANPPSFAAIDGKGGGSTPRTVTLAPGKHLVYVQNDTLNLKTSTFVILKPGDRITVFADFTQPSPTVSQR